MDRDRDGDGRISPEERAFHRQAKELGYEVRKVEPPEPVAVPAG